MPARDLPLSRPWALAMESDEVAAVCETARDAPQAVEAGVWTYAPYRQRGFGAAVTRAWARLVSDRTAFYSTQWDNTASIALARSLGLAVIAQQWQVFGAEP